MTERADLVGASDEELFAVIRRHPAEDAIIDGYRWLPEHARTE